MDIDALKQMPLTQSKFAIVDAENYDWLTQWKWNFNGNYAVRTIHGKNRITVYLHCLIMPHPQGWQTDHINGDKLDNRKKNLRICTQAENSRNIYPRKNVSSRYKGVCWHSQIKRWRSYINIAGKRHCLGTYSSEEEAAISYNIAAQKYHGGFAHLNIISGIAA